MNKERPILFNTEMVKAILAGKKTQTRRIIDVPATHNFSGWVIKSTNRKDEGKACFSLGKHPLVRDGRYKSCPFGKVGDTLWVRETFRYFDKSDECGCTEAPCNCPADKQPIYYANSNNNEEKWRPSIHMPRSSTRIFLKVTSIRVERLQNISEEDAKAEGFDHSESEAAMVVGWYEKPRKAFRRTIEQLYGNDTWESNPWVWVVEFEVMHTAN